MTLFRSTQTNFRGRFNFRHFQSLNTPEDNLTPGVDTRFAIELGYLSDRNFLEQYYKRLFDTGLDHEDVFYGYMSRDNWAATVQTELNPNAWNTETQWLPKLDYYRLGDALFDDWVTYFGHTGVDWANTHTANDVNNLNTLFYLPYDPVSNTSRTMQTGRYYTAHEIDVPINLGFLRVVPYAQGQLVAWDHQIGGEPVGRAWGAVGGRADVMAWKAYPNVESELMNVHGFNHKIDFMADFRDAWSNVNLNTLGVQDDLDDNSYEMTRRYFAMMNYAGGLLPPQYDPRFLLLRRAVSPITQSTDIQATIETLQDGDPPAAPDQARAGGASGGSSTTSCSTSTRPTSPTPTAITSARHSGRTPTISSGTSAIGRPSPPTAGSSTSTSAARRSSRSPTRTS